MGQCSTDKGSKYTLTVLQYTLVIIKCRKTNACRSSLKLYCACYSEIQNLNILYLRYTVNDSCLRHQNKQKNWYCQYICILQSIWHYVDRVLWSWSYGSCIYNYLCNQCLSPLTIWVWIPLMWGVLDTILCDKVCQ